MASHQVRIDCAGVSLQRPCLLDRITAPSNSMCHPGPSLKGKPEPVDFHWAVLFLRSEGDIRHNSPTVQFEDREHCFLILFSLSEHPHRGALAEASQPATVKSFRKQRPLGLLTFNDI